MRQIEESIFLFVSKAIVKEQKYEQTRLFEMGQGTL